MYWKIATCLMIIVFMAWHKIEVSLKMNREQKAEEAFWERERKANSIRRKPIDALDYVKIPKDLPYDLCKDNIEIPEIINTIDRLREDKILNLTGYTNTDLKLEYGTSNITVLTKYDNNFTTLVTTMQKWADILWDNGYEKEAVKLMEFLVDSKADIGKTYRLLAKYYVTSFQTEKYEELIQKAENLNSMNKPYIVDSIKEIH